MKREALIKYEKYRQDYATGLDHLFPPERMVDNYLSTLPDDETILVDDPNHPNIGRRISKKEYDAQFKSLPDEKEEPLNIYCNCYKQKKEDKEKGFCTQCEKLIISHEKLQSDKRKAR